MQALRRPHNWIQLAKFGVVGAQRLRHLHRRSTPLCSGSALTGRPRVAFIVSAANNYWWNRHWTFAHAKGHFGYQGMRFFAVSVLALAANQFWLFVFLDWLGWGKIVSAAIAVVFVTPLNFIGNKLWSFRG